jgi:hypothetical protein
MADRKHRRPWMLASAGLLALALLVVLLLAAVLWIPRALYPSLTTTDLQGVADPARVQDLKTRRLKLQSDARTTLLQVARRRYRPPRSRAGRAYAHRGLAAPGRLLVVGVLFALGPLVDPTLQLITARIVFQPGAAGCSPGAARPSTPSPPA